MIGLPVVPIWAKALVATLAVLAAIGFAVRAIDRHDAAQRGLGATAEASASLTETLNRTETANEARAEIRDPGSPARYEQCLRSARTPANCQRFLPQRPGDHDRGGAGAER